MKAQTGPIGIFANGTAERKIAAEITTTPRASRRSFRAAGRVARNGRRSALDGDSPYPPFGIVSFTPNTSRKRLCSIDATSRERCESQGWLARRQFARCRCVRFDTAGGDEHPVTVGKMGGERLGVRRQSYGDS